jgi:hypothetical protein
MHFPITILPFWQVNRPTLKNVASEIGLVGVAVASILVYCRIFSATYPVWYYTLFFCVYGLVGFCVEFFSQKFYNYNDTLFSWFNTKDFSVTFAVAYGGLFSAIHLVSLYTVTLWGIPAAIAWFFPSILFTSIIVGTVDAIFYNLVHYYEFDPSYETFLKKLLTIGNIPLLAVRVLPWNLPVAVMIVGYGGIFGVGVYNVNNVLVGLIESVVR